MSHTPIGGLLTMSDLTAAVVAAVHQHVFPFGKGGPMAASLTGLVVSIVARVVATSGVVSGVTRMSTTTNDILFVGIANALVGAFKKEPILKHVMQGLSAECLSHQIQAYIGADSALVSYGGSMGNGSVSLNNATQTGG